MKLALRDILGAAVGAILTLIGTLTANTFSFFNKDRELDIRMVDVALTILSAKDEGTKSEYASAMRSTCSLTMAA